MRSRPHVARRAVAAAILMSFTGCTATSPVGLWSRTKQDTASTAQPGVPWTLLSPNSRPPASSSVPSEFFFSARPGEADEFSVDHPRVNDFVESFQTKWRGFFDQALERSGKYVPRMTAILEEEGVPRELAYLPLIESGYRNEAVSRAGAVGPWQFVRATGRRYGLRIDRYVDERRDPVKATRAAARYLKDLYGMFGNWHLSLAAYNTGEGNVARVMDRRGADDYWEMADNGYLHRETCNYVPQFLAALQIAQAPAAHGFDEPEEQPLRYDLVRVDRQMSLRTVAKLAGSSVQEVTELNPALIRGVTPPDPGGYRVRVPEGTKEQFAVAYSQMLREARDAQPALAEAPISGDTPYRIRKGDTPIVIAKRLGVRLDVLTKLNGWKNARALRPGAVVRVPQTAAAARIKPAPARHAAGEVKKAPVAAAYRVRKGDTPAAIAKRLGVSVPALMRANGWKDPKRLRPGDAVRVPAADGAGHKRVAAKAGARTTKLN